jgi:hypothetical protein
MEQGLPMVEFPQNASRMAPASEQLYELVVNRRLVHDGDPVLREQVLNAVIAPTERGGWKHLQAPQPRTHRRRRLVGHDCRPRGYAAQCQAAAQRHRPLLGRVPT